VNAADIRFMDLALGLGRRGLGNVWPNPAVGCVVVRNGRVVGRGWTRPGGRPHAETVALAQAGAAARGATAYVTLEPCAHHGRTPPCAEALVAAGVARVVTAIEDPDPRVAGRGHALLRAAGIAVETGIGAAAARRDQAGFLSRVLHGRPMVTLKLATSLDGRIATASGESRWITGAGARRLVHGLRLAHDAVLVGGGTARADDPELTVRDLGAARQPVRAVASHGLDLPAGGRLAASAGQGPLWLLHGAEGDAVAPDRAEAWRRSGAHLLPVASRGGRLEPSALLSSLADRGITRVFCEGGGSLAAALLRAGLVDRLAVFTAGVALGAEGRPSLGPLGIDRLSAAQRFSLVEVREVEGDILHLWSCG
jgi:diaminohydroxyphosphoribosylaminopyrimidine deaminase/5-amino-6-(5-phosphoribosylamino)uracil reductase